MGEGAGTELAVSTSLEKLGDMVRDRVRDKVREEFVGAIPDEVWDGLVKKEIDDLIVPDPTSGDGKSKLERIIAVELRTVVKEKLVVALKEAVDGMWCFDTDSQGNVRANHAVRTIVRELIPDIVEAQWGRLTQECVNTLREALHRTY